jgi:hypothetical protein
MSCNTNVDIEISAQNREIGKLNKVIESEKTKEPKQGSQKSPLPARRTLDKYIYKQ